MTAAYSVEICKQLEKKFHNARLHRPMRIGRYDDGDELVYDVTAVAGPKAGGAGRVRLFIEKFVGGGFAGQVYRVKVLSIEGGPIAGIRQDGIYAMKILIPPSGFSLLFRNVVYGIGFQGAFQLQTNPTAARAGAIWQKFIKRGAKIRFGDDTVVNDIHVTFVDNRLGSCGELTDWVDGRTWRLEVDEYMDLLGRWGKGKKVDQALLGSPEYRAKKEFMADFVKLLHDMGGHEFARQYEWSTCKSQPNCLKRTASENDPATGLIAVDFRAGLALLPFLPMSPGDFKLIANGISRGSLVQFDRGDLNKLESFVNSHSEVFEDMRDLLDELKAAEQVYRDSVPDITHNHIRLLYSGALWSTIMKSTVTGWRVRNIIDRHAEENLSRSMPSTILFLLIGMVPFLGTFVRKLWGRADWRKHYAALMKSLDYFKRALLGKAAESVITWHRAGRLDGYDALRVAEKPLRFFRHWSLSLLPMGLHKFLTDWQYARQRLAYFLVRPVRLYFDARLREEWLRDMVAEGRKKHIITEEDSEVILSQINEPFIQKYLKSLAVHVCTLPITQVVSVAAAIMYVLMHPEMPRTQSWAIGLGIIALFQVVPISPGSLVRGLYVVYLVIRERNFKDYNIAVFLGFFKYIGYLSFPIQMAYRYPTLARFMAGHWATDAVHIVPVFGEGGALLERQVFCLFYNWPLTIRRRLTRRAEQWATMNSRYWHAGLLAVIAAAFFVAVDFGYARFLGVLPGLKDIAGLVVLIPLLCGAAVALGGGGTPLGRRIVSAAASGVAAALVYTALSAATGSGSLPAAGGMVAGCVWRVFIFSIFTTIGAIVTILSLSDPEVK